MFGNDCLAFRQLLTNLKDSLKSVRKSSLVYIINRIEELLPYGISLLVFNLISS